MSAAPVFGLVLAGGASRRMNVDKATLNYRGKSQLRYAFELLNSACERTFISVRADQEQEPTRAGLPQIVDIHRDIGPIAGIAAAQSAHPEAAWLVMACDLPFVDASTVQHLLRHRDAARIATAYRSGYDSLPEPLFTIWEPASGPAVKAWIGAGKECPRKLLIDSDIALIDLPEPSALDNVNTPQEFAAAQRHLAASAITLHVQYFAIFREQAGFSRETLETKAQTPAVLYEELQRRHGFQLAPSQLKVAVNSEFSDWQTPLASGDRIAFIPPVAGG